MRTKKMSKALKWALFILLALLLFCFQNAPVRIGLCENVLFILPFAVAFACYEGLVPSLAMSVVCGLFWDYSAQREFGFCALALCIICVSANLVMKYFARPIYVSCLVCCCAAALVFVLCDYFFFFVLKGYENVAALFFENCVERFFKTAVFSAIMAYAVKKIYDISPNRAKFDFD